MNNIPEKINAFNVYNSGNRLIGLSDEVTLPDFEAITETLSGPGILGEIESVAIGHFSSTEMEIPFRQMDDDMFKLINQATAVNLTLRGSIQYTDGATGGTDFKPMRVVVQGKNKSISGGKMKQGSGSASSVKLELTYILIEIDGQIKLELDKFNSVYKVNGIDQLEKVRNMI